MYNTWYSTYYLMVISIALIGRALTVYIYIYIYMTPAREPNQVFIWLPDWDQLSDFWRRHLGGGILEEASGGVILGVASWRRHLGGGIWRHLGGIWRQLGGIWEASGGIWEASGRHLEASGSHLGDIWRHPEASGGVWGIWRHLGVQKWYTSHAKCNFRLKSINFTMRF